MTTEDDASWQPSDNEKLAIECLYQVLWEMQDGSSSRRDYRVTVWANKWDRIHLFTKSAVQSLQGDHSRAAALKAEADAILD
jgi:hypothetical protein